MATKLLYGALAVIPSALALSAAITPAIAFEVERGPHGSSRIVSEPQAETSQDQPPVKAQTTETRRSTIIIRGPHGAQKLVTQDGVGGPVQEYKGFPKLEQRGSHGAFHIVND